MATDGSREMGIGIITYNRLPALQGCVQYIEEQTRMPYRLVIADDGSDDGSAAWAREKRLRVITGERRGVAWNKNRALYYLMERTECDPVLLLEDDTWPAEPGWERIWVEAAWRWGHLNCAPPPALIAAGSGTAADPYRSKDYTAQCTVTTRETLEVVGYLDTRFAGWGFEHVEWTTRFWRHLHRYWGPPAKTYPLLPHGPSFQLPSFGSWYNEEDVARNRRVMDALDGEPIRREAWRTPEEEAIVRMEQATL